jgi:uncharacterized membrane protein
MKRVIFIALSLSATLIVLSHCSDATSDYEGANSNSSAELIPTYAKGVKAVITENCIGCHSKYGTLSGVQSNYTEIMDSINAANGKRQMPPNGTISAAHKVILVKWGTSPNEPYGQYAP